MAYQKTTPTVTSGTKEANTIGSGATEDIRLRDATVFATGRAIAASNVPLAFPTLKTFFQERVKPELK